MEKDRQVLATNRKAHHAYHILETYEAGIVLQGSEVKSIRSGQATLQEGFARIERGAPFLYQVHIKPYQPAGGWSYDPMRPRKLLMHRREIERLMGRIQQGGYTLVPLEMYLVRGRVKVSVALAKGKRGPDKREDLHRKVLEREIERDFKTRHHL